MSQRYGRDCVVDTVFDSRLQFTSLPVFYDRRFFGTIYPSRKKSSQCVGRIIKRRMCVRRDITKSKHVREIHRTSCTRDQIGSDLRTGGTSL